MANDLTKNPWLIDTPGATTLTTERLYVKGVRWVGASTAGHQAVIQDRNSRVVWESVASGADHVESDLIETPDAGWDGMKVPTLQSGKLYIELA
jgi:hypothetical protein